MSSSPRSNHPGVRRSGAHGKRTELQLEIERLLQLVFDIEPPRLGAPDRLRVDVFESDDAVLVLAEAPGVTADQVEVEIEGLQLRLRLNKPADPQPKVEMRFQQIERQHGSFAREIRLSGTPINTRRAEARLRNGILELRLPKVHETRNQPILLNVRDDDE